MLVLEYNISKHVCHTGSTEYNTPSCLAAIAMSRYNTEIPPMIYANDVDMMGIILSCC